MSLLSQIPSFSLATMIQYSIGRYLTCTHRLSINRPTKRGKEKSPSDGHCEKEMLPFTGVSTNS
jgi:hypothetical protein